MDLANGERPLNRGEAPHNPPKSLAEKSRRIEQQRIDDENQRIVRNGAVCLRAPSLTALSSSKTSPA